MSLSVFTFIGWFAFIISCYYVIRPLPYRSIRIILTLSLCILLTYISCQDLLLFTISSISIVSGCWLISIRLIHLTVFSRDPSLTFRYFLFKTLWITFPILPKHLAKNQWPIIHHLILAVIKLLINHWVYQWMIRCPTRVSSDQVFLFFLSMITISYMMDVQMVFLRIITRDKYTLESFTDFPLLSLSLREFWGQGYNRYVNTVLKESVFQPIRMEYSPTIGGLTTFIISGLLHVHIAYIVYDDISFLFPTFMFFVLHGIACCFEAKMKLELPKYVAWLLTHGFLISTAPLMVAPFIKEGSPFFMLNPPPLFDAEWIPKLPVPNFCLQ